MKKLRRFLPVVTALTLLSPEFSGMDNANAAIKKAASTKPKTTKKPTPTTMVTTTTTEIIDMRSQHDKDYEKFSKYFKKILADTSYVITFSVGNYKLDNGSTVETPRQCLPGVKVYIGGSGVARGVLSDPLVTVDDHQNVDGSRTVYHGVFFSGIAERVSSRGGAYAQIAPGLRDISTYATGAEFKGSKISVEALKAMIAAAPDCSTDLSVDYSSPDPQAVLFKGIEMKAPDGSKIFVSSFLPENQNL